MSTLKQKVAETVGKLKRKAEEKKHVQVAEENSEQKAKKQCLDKYKTLKAKLEELTAVRKEVKEQLEMAKLQEEKAKEQLRSARDQVLFEEMSQFLVGGDAPLTGKSSPSELRMVFCSDWVDSFNHKLPSSVCIHTIKHGMVYNYNVEEYGNATKKLVLDSTSDNLANMPEFKVLEDVKGSDIDIESTNQGSMMSPAKKVRKILEWIGRLTTRPEQTIRASFSFWNFEALETVTQDDEIIDEITIDIDFIDNNGVVGSGELSKNVILITNQKLSSFPELQKLL